MKYIYIVITIEEEGRYHSYGIKVETNTNLLSKLNIKNMINAHLCESRGQCFLLATSWNKSYKENGTYLFDKPSF